MYILIFIEVLTYALSRKKFPKSDYLYSEIGLNSIDWDYIL
jgi:hypothetical protein